MKAIYGFLGKQYTMTHHLIEEEYKAVLNSIPPQATYMDYGRLFEISQLWARWRESIFYGNQKLAVAPPRIFKKKEAELAVEHERECKLGAEYIRQDLEKRKHS